jgi:hypothetical protein
LELDYSGTAVTARIAAISAGPEPASWGLMNTSVAGLMRLTRQGRSGDRKPA